MNQVAQEKCPCLANKFCFCRGDIVINSANKRFAYDLFLCFDYPLKFDVKCLIVFAGKLCFSKTQRVNLN